MGCFRDLDLFYGILGILVLWFVARYRYNPRPCYWFKTTYLLGVIIRLEWFCENLATFLDRVIDLGRYFHTSGTFCTHYRIHGLCNIRYPWMAYNDLPAVFRGRGDLFGLCDGTDLIADLT